MAMPRPLELIHIKVDSAISATKCQRASHPPSYHHPTILFLLGTQDDIATLLRACLLRDYTTS